MKHIFCDDEGTYHYFDKNGVELHDGDFVRRDDGRIEKLYLSEDEQLGTDATNPVWIESGRAAPCEYGLFPLCGDDCKYIEKI